MQVAEGRNLIDMYRHHSTSHIWNKIEYVVIFFAVLCTYFSIHSTNFVRNMIPTFLRFKVCDSQRTFYLDQSSRSTTVQSYGKGEVHINCHKSQKFALFSEKPNCSSHNSPKYCTYGLLLRYAMYLQPNLLGTKSRDLILPPS